MRSIKIKLLVVLITVSTSLSASEDKGVAEDALLKPLVFSTDLPLDSPLVQAIVPKLTKAFKLIGYQFIAINSPSERSLILANKGMIDGEISRAHNFHQVTDNQYANLIRIEHKMTSTWLSLFSARKDIKIDELEDLSSYNLGYFRGRKLFTKMLKDYVPESNIHQVEDDLQGFKMLALNRVDLFMTSKAEGYSLINSQADFNQIAEVKQIAEIAIYSYIHKKHQALLPELLDSLKRIETTH